MWILIDISLMRLLLYIFVKIFLTSQFSIEFVKENWSFLIVPAILAFLQRNLANFIFLWCLIKIFM